MHFANSNILQCQPPSSFTPAGEVYEAEVSQVPPPFVRQTRRTGRRGAGIRYEKSVQEYLLNRYGQAYIPSPWLRFRSDNGWRWCQPDGLILQPAEARIIVVEVKYQHTSDAWWQVERLYKPVLRKLFNDEWKFDACEVVKWYDGTVPYPCRVMLCEDVSRVPPEAFGVHIYRPGKTLA